MNKNELIEVVKDIMSQELMITMDSVELDTDLENLDIDSLDVMKMAIALENTFDIRIETRELTQIETFGDVISGIEDKLKSK